METLIFEEGRHRYYLEGQKDKPFTGVTTVLGVIAKPALIAWSAKMATEYIRENVAYAIPGENGGFWAIKPNIVEEAKNAHNRKKDSAADIGTAVHEAVEMYIKGETPVVLDEQGQKMFDKFVKWATDNKVKFLASEKRLYSKKHWIAGTCDFICEIDGKKYLGDFKTSSGIYGREYFAQCSAYRMMEEENGATDFHGSIIVRCGKDGSFETKESFDYETDLKMFLAALTIYRITNNY